jgi:hypothetical protein
MLFLTDDVYFDSSNFLCNYDPGDVMNNDLQIYDLSIHNITECKT